MPNIIYEWIACAVHEVKFTLSNKQASDLLGLLKQIKELAFFIMNQIVSIFIAYIYVCIQTYNKQNINVRNIKIDHFKLEIVYRNLISSVNKFVSNF